MPVTATSTCPCGASRSRTDSDTSSAGKLLPHPVDGINRDIEHPHLPEHFRQFFFHELPAPVSLDHFRGVVRHEIAHPSPCIDYSLPGQQVVCPHDGLTLGMRPPGLYRPARMPSQSLSAIWRYMALSCLKSVIVLSVEFHFPEKPVGHYYTGYDQNKVYATGGHGHLMFVKHIRRSQDYYHYA